MASESGNTRDMLDIIFQNRNRAYGAYVMRREYPQYLGKALRWGLLLIALFFAAPYIMDKVSGLIRNRPLDVEAVMGPPPDIDPNTPPPPPPPPVETPPPPQRSTVAYVPPVVKKDEEVPEEKIQNVEEIKKEDADISNVNKEGTDDAPPPEVVTQLQTKVEEKKPVEEEQVYDFVEKAPAFPGGEAEMLKYLSQNIVYPPLAKESNIQGRVVVSFVVSKTGTIDDVKIMRDLGGGLGKEAVRVVSNMPKWNPGEQNGHPVKVKYVLPVLFRLE